MLQEKGQLDAATQKKIADTQRDMVKKMCTTNGHLTISIARYVDVYLCCEYLCMCMKQVKLMH